MSSVPQQTIMEMVPDVFQFVKSYVIPTISPNHIGLEVNFELVPESNFNAGIKWSESEIPSIFINDGAVIQIFDICVECLEFFEDSANNKELSDTSNNATIGLTYTTALLFLTLHEYSHLAAGHVAYIQEYFPETLSGNLGYSEIDRTSESSDYYRFRKMSELEADGTAFALVMDFKEDICESIGLTSVGNKNSYVFQRSVLMGCFVSICLLEGLFEADQEIEREYPFAASRLINLCSSYLRVVDPNIVRWKDGNHRYMGGTTKQTNLISRTYENTIAPALLNLHLALISRGIESELFNEGIDTDTSTSFMRDIIMVIGGNTPNNSKYGRALADLSKYRTDFMLSLLPYRQLDLWPVGEV